MPRRKTEGPPSYPTAPGSGSEASLTGHRLWQVANAWQRAQRNAMESIGLTHVQYVLLDSLDTLSNDNGSASQIELAEHAQLDVMMTSQALRALEGKVLVQRTPCEQDGRAKRVSLTPEGRALAQRGRQLAEAVDSRFFIPLGRDLKRFTENLGTLL